MLCLVFKLKIKFFQKQKNDLDVALKEKDQVMVNLSIVNRELKETRKGIEFLAT